MDRNQVNAVANETVEFVLQGQFAEGVDGGYQAVVAVDLEISVVFAVFMRVAMKRTSQMTPRMWSVCS